jgi:hypothetical protein
MARGAPGNFNLDYAKQSQFPEGQVNVTFFQKKDYKNSPHFQARKNKPNQSQCRSSPVMRNKANLLRAQMNITFSTDTDYMNKCPLGARKNKAK